MRRLSALTRSLHAMQAGFLICEAKLNAVEGL
jgi:hypothetical protein